MSIINEALKKAGKETTLASQSPRADQLLKGIVTEAPASRRTSKINWGPLFVLSVLVLITGPIVAPVFSTPFKNLPTSFDRSPDLSQAPIAPSVMSTRQAQFGIEEVSLPSGAVTASMAIPPNLLLSGIVFSSENSYCILNDKVVKVGEEISGARLVSIQSDSVTIDFQGQAITIPVS
jgi:hypothetical protein